MLPLNNYFPCKIFMYIYLRLFLVILTKKILAKANSMQKPDLPMRSVCKIQTKEFYVLLTMHPCIIFFK